MYCKLFYMCFFVFTTVIKADKPTVPSMKLKLTLSESNNQNQLTCDQTKEKNYSVLALEGVLLHISIEYDKLLDDVRCYDDDDEKNSSIVFLDKKDIPSKAVNKVNVTQEMGCNWTCRILTHRDNSVIKPIKTINGTNYTEAICYIKVHVRLINAPHKMRVNYMLMEPTRNPVEIVDVDHYAEYKYKNGDKVNIFCFKDNGSSKECKLVMKYYYEELKDHELVLNSNTVIQSNIQLHMNHSGSYIDCIYICKRDIQVQRMKFVLGSDFNNGMKLFINEQEARLDTSKSFVTKSAQNKISVPYHIFKHEHFDVKCGENEEYNCNSICTPLVKKCTKLEIKNINNRCAFYCDDRNQNKAIELNIQTTDAFNDNKFKYLTLNYPYNNSVMSFLHDKERIIYYEFDDNDEMEVSCIRHPLKSGYTTYISTTKKAKADISSNMQNDTLKMSHHGVYTCALYETATASAVPIVMYKITVVFIKKKIDIIQVTTSDPLANVVHNDRTDEDVGNTAVDNVIPRANGGESKYIIYIYIAVGIVIAIVVFCVPFIVYKMNKRNQTGPAVYENFNSETTTIQHPSQWSDDRIAESAPTYAVPIPKSQRPTRIKPDNSVIYADLYQQPVDNAFREETEQYAEVYSQALPKSVRNYRNNQDNYVNYFSDSTYENSGRSEYVEPTYAETYSSVK